MNSKRYNTHTGFTLLELLIAITILAMVMAVGLASIKRPNPRYERETFIARLNGLLFLGWQQALKTDKVHRIEFDFGTRTVVVASATGNTEKQGKKPTFVPLPGKYIRSSLTIPKNVKLENFIIEGYDETKNNPGKAITAWFYIMPSGLTQEVTIHFWDTKDLVNKKPRPIGLVLNPFTAQFDIHDTFQQ